MPIEITMDCPTCPSRLTFASRGLGAGRRLWSRCGGCGRAFALWGGRLQPLEGPVRDEPAPRRLAAEA